MPLERKQSYVLLSTAGGVHYGTAAQQRPSLHRTVVVREAVRNADHLNTRLKQAIDLHLRLWF